MPAYDDPDDRFTGFPRESDDFPPEPDGFDPDEADLSDPSLSDAALAGATNGQHTPEEIAANAEAVRARLTALVRGDTGVRFESLVLFADPLFELFGMDSTVAFGLREAPESADEGTAALLETARMLWAYFTLAEPERARRRDTLAARLIGPEPTEEDWVDLESLLETVEPYWNAMLPEEVAEAQRTGHPTLDFDALLKHPAFRVEGAEKAGGWGPDGLPEIEARALFAQPLLEDPAAAADVDAFEAAMERASEFWHLALHPHAERADALAAHVAAHAPDPEHAPRVEAEARRMLARFDALFPEHAR